MQLSVIIPSYNRAQTLIRAIDSVLDQESAVDEIIVVDDGSSDDTAVQITENYPGIKLIQQSNQGVSAARNAGIKQAGYEWIAFRTFGVRDAASGPPSIASFGRCRNAAYREKS